MGAIDSLTSDQQLEAIYVGYYGRGGDSGGFAFWEQQYASAIASGQNPSQAIENVANAFAPQSETKALYPQIVNLTPPLNPGSQIEVNAVTDFVNSVYLNVFNRALASGDTYWVNQILNNQVTIGQAILFIENGATGTDATTLTNKISVASAFTNQTSAAGLGFSTPTTAYLNEATAIVGTTTSAASGPGSVAVQTAAITTWVAGGGGATGFTLTPNADSFSTTTANAQFNAYPIVSSFGILNNTLNAGDNLQDSNGDGTLNFSASDASNANGPFAVGVTLSGIKTLDYAGSFSGGGVRGGFQGNVTGLTVVNDTGSTGGLTLGGLGQGLKTALTNVNISGYAPIGGIFPGTPAMFSAAIAASVGTATAPLAIAITGPVGTAAGNGAAVIAVSTDGSPGTAAAPNAAYKEWDLTLNSNANLQLQQNGVGGVTTLKLSGAGNVAIGQDAVGNWQKLTTIDASGETGAVTITGGSSGLAGNAFRTTLDPTWLQGSAAGFLNDATGTFALTTVNLGSGVTILDASSASVAEIAALTAGPGTGVTAAAGDTIIVSSTVADTTSTATFAHITGFDTLGVTTPHGTIDQTNLPASIKDILYTTGATGAVTINHEVSGLTVDFHGNAGFQPLTVNGPTSGAATLNLDFGNATLLVEDNTGPITTTGVSNVAITATGDGVAGHVDSAASITLSSTVTTGLTVTIAGGQDFNTGAVSDLSATPSLAQDALTITDTGHVNVGTTNFGIVNGAASAGLIVNDSFHNATITGSAAGNNTLTGGDGGGLAGTGNTITGGSGTDTIVTGIGANTITLGATHTGDTVTIGSGNGGVVTGAGDTAHQGAWGQPAGSAPEFIGGIAASIFGTAVNGGTSASQTVISGFSIATGSTDVLRFEAGAWNATNGANSLAGVDQGLQKIDLTGHVATGDLVLTEAATSGGALTAGANLIEINPTVNYANAAALAQGLQSSFALTTGALASHNDAHFLVAYNAGSVIKIADVALYNTTAAATTASTADHVYASDVVQLTGVTTYAQLNAHLDHFA